MAQVESPAAGAEQPARPPTGMDAIRIEGDGSFSATTRGGQEKRIRPIYAQCAAQQGGRAAYFLLAGRIGASYRRLADNSWSMGTGNGIPHHRFQHRSKNG